jgi:hypothetical protein
MVVDTKSDISLTPRSVRESRWLLRLITDHAIGMARISFRDRKGESVVEGDLYVAKMSRHHGELTVINAHAVATANANRETVLSEPQLGANHITLPHISGR